MLSLSDCASGGNSESRGLRRRTDVIETDELMRAGAANAYDVINSLRPQWLQERGPDTIHGRGGVQVVVDDMKVGGVAALRNLNPAEITYIQHFDALAATSRWGLGFGDGAIYVSTRKR